jgi:uncharacterized protein (DUF2147 family)
MQVQARMWWAVGVVGIALAGCGAAQEEPSQDVQRLEQRVKDAEQKAADAQAIAAAAAKKVQEKADSVDDSEPVAEDTAGDETSSSDSSGGSGCIKVPNVVGKDHQLAQDTMQAAGLYMLQEEDATGEGRMLLLDRNWTTVRQRPKAGKCVSENAEIMLYAVKDEER